MSLDEWLGIGIPDDIVDDAIAWVAKLDGDTIDPDEKRAFFDWLDAAPEHQWAYEEISEAWSKLKGLQAVKDSLVRSEVIYLEPAVQVAQVSSSVSKAYAVMSWASIVLMLTGLLAGVVA